MIMSKKGLLLVVLTSSLLSQLFLSAYSLPEPAEVSDTLKIVQDAAPELTARSVTETLEPKTLGAGALITGVVGRPHVPVSTVAFLTLLMAVATGLGAIPFFFFTLNPAWQGICNGIACGVMLAASFDLVVEGQAHGGGECVVAGILLGGLFILVSQRMLESFGDVKMMDLKGADARKMVLIVAIMTLHSFGEGSGVGVSFAGPKGYQQGLLVTIAIAVHNIPEGLAVSMVMASRGVPARSALLWSVFTSLPQPLVAVPAFLCADMFNQFLPICVGFAAGCMIWMVFGEVMPDSLKESNPSHVATAATISVAVMEAVGTALQGLDRPGSIRNSLPRMLWSLLFLVGPFLGGLLIVTLRSIIRLHPTLLSGLSAGVMLVLSVWRPLHLWLGKKIGFFPILGLLYGGAFLYIAVSRIWNGVRGGGRQRVGDGEVMRVDKGGLSPVDKATILACGAVVSQALVQGVVMGVAIPSPHGDGMGLGMLLPAALHGVPRGVAVAGAMYGGNKNGNMALLGAAITGLAGPVGAWGSILGGLTGKWVECWMVLACGALIPAAGNDLLLRAIRLDRKRTLAGLGMGLVFVILGLGGTRFMCLNTLYCNAAPEAVT